MAATVSAAQAIRDTSSRRAFLWRALDGWLLPMSQASAMREDPFPTVRAQAAGVMASNVDPARIPLLARYMGDGDARVREQVMLAAGRIGPAGLELGLHGLRDVTPRVRRAAAWAVAHGGSRAFEPLTALLSKERSPLVKETLLANLWRLEESPWQAAVSSFAENPDPYLRRAAAYSLSRTGESTARKAQRKLVGDVEPVIRATILRGFERGSLEKADLEVVTTALRDPDWRVRAAACRVLAAQAPVELGRSAIDAVVGGFSSAQPHLAVSALAAAGGQPKIGTNEELLAIAENGEPYLAAAALNALARRDAAKARPLARAWFESAEPWRWRAAAAAAAKLDGDLEKQAATHGEPSVRLAWLSGLERTRVSELRDKLLTLIEKDTDPAVRTQALSLMRSAGVAPDVDDLVGLYTAWKRDVMPDARAEALVSALATSKAAEERAGIITLGLADPDPAVAAMVVNGARSLDLPVTLPGREPRHGRLWYDKLASWVEVPRWLDVMTDRGTFRIRLDLEAAPLTSREIWDLASGGFYDGLGFHRVVPNFVVQGGDPRGDGWGGPGFVLPDEPSLQPFDSWRVGVATSGPETGGCQLFFTLLPADHLTGHYTNIGEVVAGREVLTTLRVGDTIQSITPRSGTDLPQLTSSTTKSEIVKR
ncbi:MAG: peptidylprolyl isomerase [Acidobacteria bacterium]|nr:peptidylprolyl isomerase [Acidobacteriota bacterium]